MPDNIQRRTSFPEHIIQFIRYFRTKGFKIGPNETSELLQVLAQQTPKSFEQQQQLFKALLVKNRKQFVQFDSLYEDYWKQLERAEDSKIKEEEEEQPKPRPNQNQNTLNALKNWLYSGRQKDELDMATYSAIEAIGKKDFSSFNTDEYQDLLEIIRLIAKKIANKKSRRFVTSKSQKQLDLKKTINNALRKGGEIYAFKFRERQIKKTNLILLCDVSRSMDLNKAVCISAVLYFALD